MKTTVAYRGFLICTNTINGAMWIEKDGLCYQYVKSTDEAKAIIDALLA